MNRSLNRVVTLLSHQVCRNYSRTICSLTMSKLCFKNYDAIGFDVDHTFAKYNIPHLFNTVYDGFVEFLVKNRDWDKSLQEPFHTHKDFCTRGILLDIKRGNFLKLAQDGQIIRASHGTHFLSEPEICSVYGERKHWAPTDQLVGKVDNKSGDFMIFDNFYDCIGIPAIGRMIDIVDEKLKKKNQSIDDYQYIWEDAMAAYDDMYRFEAFKEETGGFFPNFKKETGKFLQVCPDETKQWLQRLRKEGKVLFLMTSSYVDFAQASLEYIFGGDWHEYFDLVLTRARKPGFFFKDNKFHQMDGTVEDQVVDSLNRGHVYSQGNLSTLMDFFKKETKVDEPKVLFFGDSLRSDIYPSKNYASWDTVMLVEEMQAEDLSMKKEEEMTAATKRQKMCRSVPTLESEYLTSTLWGSFFTDTRSQDASLSDAASRPDMNTLWGYIVRMYADVAIPLIDYITELPLDHEFEVFDHKDSKKLGFYPELPAALEAKKA